MFRRAFLTACASLLLAVATLPAALAGEAMLTAAQIERLLAGNTVSGDWGGAYKQFYGADGFTMYVPASGNKDEGKWRVNAEDNSYESWWASTGWTAYKVAQDGGRYFWIDSKGDKYPFEVLKGKQVNW